jgi:rubrerythrin
MLLNDKDILQAAKNEAFARCRYEVFAEIARKEGLHYFAKILEETANNELSHFREFMDILGLIGNTKDNLEAAIASEADETSHIYPDLHQRAMGDGKLDTARLFQQIGKIEDRHRQRLEKLSEILAKDSVYLRTKAIVWKCRVCGYVHQATQPPNMCPGCQSGMDAYEPEDFSV